MSFSFLLLSVFRNKVRTVEGNRLFAVYSLAASGSRASLVPVPVTPSVVLEGGTVAAAAGCS